MGVHRRQHVLLAHSTFYLGMRQILCARPTHTSQD
jgi:hypothetical protein